MLTPGETIAGRYRIEGPLGEGGYGIVYRATDTLLQRAVALKVLADVRARGRVLIEARAAARLAHPAIVAVFDVGEDGARAFLAMELVDGESLRHRMRRGPVERAVAIAWLGAIAEALAAAHGAGIVHLDVKPENVLVAGGERVKVADFGLAVAVAAGDAVVPSRIAGTPRYMAPEQLLGEPVDGRADQYAWAIVAFELLAGVHPRDLRRDVVDDDAFTLHERPPRLDEVSEVGAAVGEVIARAMAKRPEHRFATMAELVAAWTAAIARPAVRQVAREQVTLPTVDDRARPAVRSGLGSRVAAIAIAAAGVAAIAGVGLALRRPESPAAAPAPAPLPVPPAPVPVPVPIAVDAALPDAAPPPPPDAAPPPPPRRRPAATYRMSPKPPEDDGSCPAGHLLAPTTGLCAVPCTADRECPADWICTDRYGPRTCWSKPEPSR